MTRGIAAPAVAERARQRLAAQYLQLTKARLSAMVLLTTAVGFMLASPPQTNWALLAWTVIGTALAAGCAAALNQAMEIHLDRRMRRTRARPLPSGAMSLTHAFVAAMAMGAGGIAILATKVNLLASWLALATIVIYVLLYTPLKTRSTLNTLVGAVCGALPPMIGWVAAAGRVDLGAWLLGAILFVWQIPHFFALAWLYRADYERGGFKMLPVIDRDGRLTCQVILLTTLLLLPLGLLATTLSLAGVIYAAGSLVLGLWLLFLGARLYVERTDANARRVFLASITYLPALLLLLVLDRGPLGDAVPWRDSAVAAEIVAATTDSHTVALPR